MYNQKRIFSSNYFSQQEPPQNSTIVDEQIKKVETETSSMNQYLFSVLCPMEAKDVRLPDLNSTPLVPKTITYLRTLTSPADSWSGLIVFNPYNRRNQFRFYEQDPVSLNYYFNSYIDPEEDLSDNFSRVRPVTGGFNFYSDTISSTNFTLGGTCSAIQCLDLPNLMTLSSQTLSSFKRDSTSAALNVKLSDGLLVNAEPTDETDLLPYQTNSVVNTDCILTTAFSATSVVSPATQYPNWGDMYVLTGTSVPVNLHGRIRLEANMTELIVVSSNQMGFRLGVRGHTCVNGTVTAVQAYYEWREFVELGKTFSTSAVAELDVDFDVEQIFLQYCCIGGTLTVTVPGLVIHLLSYGYYSYNSNSPASVLLFEGVNKSQTLKFSGVTHWEAQPDFTLSKNLQTSFEKSIEDPHHIKIVQLIFGNKQTFGIKSIYPISEYKQKLLQGDFITLAGSKMGSYFASTDFIPLLKQLGKQAMPYISSLLSAYNPILGTVSTAIGNGLFAGNGNSYGGKPGDFFAGSFKAPQDTFSKFPPPFEENSKKKKLQFEEVKRNLLKLQSLKQQLENEISSSVNNSQKQIMDNLIGLNDIINPFKENKDELMKEKEEEKIIEKDKEKEIQEKGLKKPFKFEDTETFQNLTVNVETEIKKPKSANVYASSDEKTYFISNPEQRKKVIIEDLCSDLLCWYNNDDKDKIVGFGNEGDYFASTADVDIQVKNPEKRIKVQTENQFYSEKEFEEILDKAFKDFPDKMTDIDEDPSSNQELDYEEDEINPYTPTEVKAGMDVYDFYMSKNQILDPDGNFYAMQRRKKPTKITYQVEPESEEGETEVLDIKNPPPQQKFEANPEDIEILGDMPQFNPEGGYQEINLEFPQEQQQQEIPQQPPLLPQQQQLEQQIQQEVSKTLEAPTMPLQVNVPVMTGVRKKFIQPGAKIAIQGTSTTSSVVQLQRSIMLKIVSLESVDPSDFLDKTVKIMPASAMPGEKIRGSGGLVEMGLPGGNRIGKATGIMLTSEYSGTLCDCFYGQNIWWQSGPSSTVGFVVGVQLKKPAWIEPKSYKYTIFCPPCFDDQYVGMTAIMLALGEKTVNKIHCINLSNPPIPTPLNKEPMIVGHSYYAALYAAINDYPFSGKFVMTGEIGFFGNDLTPLVKPVTGIPVKRAICYKLNKILLAPIVKDSEKMIDNTVILTSDFLMGKIGTMIEVHSVSDIFAILAKENSAPVLKKVIQSNIQLKLKEKEIDPNNIIVDYIEKGGVEKYVKVTEAWLNNLAKSVQKDPKYYSYIYAINGALKSGNKQKELKLKRAMAKQYLSMGYSQEKIGTKKVTEVSVSETPVINNYSKTAGRIWVASKNDINEAYRIIGAQYSKYPEIKKKLETALAELVGTTTSPKPTEQIKLPTKKTSSSKKLINFEELSKIV